MLSPGGRWSGLTETLHFQRMRCWDDLSQYLLKPQAEAFPSSDGCLKWTCSAGVGFMPLHLHVLAGAAAQPTACRRLCPLLGARWSLWQADTTLIKEQLPSVHLHTQVLTHSF